MRRDKCQVLFAGYIRIKINKEKDTSLEKRAGYIWIKKDTSQDMKGQLSGYQ
jgi:hypothetical protein